MWGLRLYPTRAFVLLSALLALSVASSMRADEGRALVVGGGPSPENNQIAIENNVKYFLRLLPGDWTRSVFFADGDPEKETVLFESTQKEMKPAERMLALVLHGRRAANTTSLKFRKPSLAHVDGPAKKPEILTAFDRLSSQKAEPNHPLLLYFTGHGSPAKNRDLDNNVFDLWDGGTLSVRELAENLAKLPRDQPVALVMVQCYSGAFGNLLFEGGDPQGVPIERDVAGFFATVKERMAAGCTPEVDEAGYQDFSTHFFAALTGRDRVGRKVTGADYDRDGKVSMHEAFCYTLVTDSSIDIPVCTSDVFLRRVVTTTDEEIFKTHYKDVRKWATPAQRAALEDLSKHLKLEGDERGRTAYDRFRGAAEGQTRENAMAAARRAFSSAQQEARRILLGRWPDLRERQSTGYEAARAGALEMIERQIAEGTYKELVEAEKAIDAAEEEEYRREIADARQTRFVRLFKTIVLTHTLLETGEQAARKRLEKLLAAESRTLLPPARQASMKTSEQPGF
jgi:hypothetical protein